MDGLLHAALAVAAAGRTGDHARLVVLGHRDEVRLDDPGLRIDDCRYAVEAPAPGVAAKASQQHDRSRTWSRHWHSAHRRQSWIGRTRNDRRLCLPGCRLGAVTTIAILTARSAYCSMGEGISGSLLRTVSDDASSAIISVDSVPTRSLFRCVPWRESRGLLPSSGKGRASGAPMRWQGLPGPCGSGSVRRCSGS